MSSGLGWASSWGTFRDRLAFLLGVSHDGRRDLYTQFGWPKLILMDQLVALYRRNPIAHRVIKSFPQDTWRDTPVVRDDQGDSGERGNKSYSPFVEAVENLFEKHRLIHRLERADRAASLGEYGALLLGFRDGKQLHEPLEKGNAPLMFVQPYAQINCVINSWCNDPADPRFGLPQLYTLKTGNPVSGENVAQKRSITAHWTRVIHIAENLEEDDVFSVPRLLPVFNNLLDLEKVIGASAETFWLNARPGLSLEADPEFSFTEEQLADYKKQAEEYENQLRRILAMQGVKATNLTASIADPSTNVQSLIKMISGATGIPERILVGSERGELGGDNDETNWNQRIDQRRNNFATPVVLKPVVQRLIDTNNLPPPQGQFRVEWPGDAQSPEKVAQIGASRTQALAAYVQAPGAEFVVPFSEFRKEFLGLPALPPEDAAFGGEEVDELLARIQGVTPEQLDQKDEAAQKALEAPMGLPGEGGGPPGEDDEGDEEGGPPKPPGGKKPGGFPVKANANDDHDPETGRFIDADGVPSRGGAKFAAGAATGMATAGLAAALAYRFRAPIAFIGELARNRATYSALRGAGDGLIKYVQMRRSGTKAAAAAEKLGASGIMAGYALKRAFANHPKAATALTGKLAGKNPTLTAAYMGSASGALLDMWLPGAGSVLSAIMGSPQALKEGAAAFRGPRKDVSAGLMSAASWLVPGWAGTALGVPGAGKGAAGLYRKARKFDSAVDKIGKKVKAYAQRDVSADSLLAAMLSGDQAKYAAELEAYYQRYGSMLAGDDEDNDDDLLKTNYNKDHHDTTGQFIDADGVPSGGTKGAAPEEPKTLSRMVIDTLGSLAVSLGAGQAGATAATSLSGAGAAVVGATIGRGAGSFVGGAAGSTASFLAKTQLMGAMFGSAGTAAGMAMGATLGSAVGAVLGVGIVTISGAIAASLAGDWALAKMLDIRPIGDAVKSVGDKIEAGWHKLRGQEQAPPWLADLQDIMRAVMAKDQDEAAKALTVFQNKYRGNREVYEALKDALEENGYRVGKQLED